MNILETGNFLQTLRFIHKRVLSFPEHKYHCFWQDNILVVLEESFRYSILKGKVNNVYLYGCVLFSQELYDFVSNTALGGFMPFHGAEIWAMDVTLHPQNGLKSLGYVLDGLKRFPFFSQNGAYDIWIEPLKTNIQFSV